MRPSIEVCLVNAVSSIQFEGEDQAQAAYSKLIDALQNFSKYDNDKTSTVEVETLEGKAAFRLESMQSVMFNKSTSGESALRERLLMEKRAREMREELGLPDLSAK